MALFGSKKKKRKAARSFGAGTSSKEDAALELFRATALSSGTSVADSRRLEREVFGRAFEDLLADGYVPSLGLTADDGGMWTAIGKLPKDRIGR